MPDQDPILSLDAYAAVIAGLDAGLDLRRSLLHAEVTPALWEEGSAYWQAQIDESAASDLAVIVAFDGALLSARRRFEPTFEPIESDDQAWAQFRRHFLTAVDPIEFLKAQGMSLSAYARLEADWANRLLENEELGAVFHKHMGEPLGECPKITVRPSPFLVQPEEPCEEGGSDEDATTTSTLEPLPQSPAETLPRNPPSIPERPSFALEAMAPTVPNPGIDHRPLPQGTMMAIEVPKGPVLPFTPGSAPRPSAVPSSTVMAFAAPQGPALPFTPVPASTVPAPATPEQPKSAPKEPAPKAETLPTFTLEQYASLCVELDASPDGEEAVLKRYGITAEQRARLDKHWADQMSKSPSVWLAWDRARTQYKQWFTKATAGANPKPLAPSTPPPKSPASSDVVPTGTMAVDASFFTRPALPFEQRSDTRQPPLSPQEGTSRPPKLPAASLNETALGQVPSKGLPFAKSSPSNASAMSPAPPGPGDLTLEVYAEVFAQLSANPACTDEVCSQHRLTVPSWTTVHQRWQARLAADKEISARFQSLVADYRSRLPRST